MSQIQSKTQLELLRDKFPEKFVAVGYVDRDIVAEYCVKNPEEDAVYNCNRVWGHANKVTVEDLLRKLREKGTDVDGAPVYEVKVKKDDYWVAGVLLAKMFLGEAEKRAERFLSTFNTQDDDKKAVMKIDGRPEVFRCSGQGENPLVFYLDRYVIRARGNTYPYRELLKQLGYTWDSEERTWVVATGDSPTFPFFANRLLATAELASWLAEQGINVCVDLRIIIKLEKRLEEFKKKYGSQ